MADHSEKLKVRYQQRRLRVIALEKDTVSELLEECIDYVPLSLAAKIANVLDNKE